MTTKSPQNNAQAPALAHIDTWIFDLDNTLYPARCNLFDQIDYRMTAFIADHLKLTPVDARKLQKDYYFKHGTSLRGLMVEHDMTPEPFLDFVHDIDVSALPQAPHMAEALLKLPGQKIVYTNGSIKHAENVLGQLGLDAHIDVLHGIDTSDYIPKPDPHGYHLMMERHQIDPERSVMVEDSVKNLVTAKELGMTTVLVEDVPSQERFTSPDHHQAAREHVDIFIDDTGHWLVQVSQDF